MSSLGTSGDNRDGGQERHPIDLVSKKQGDPAKGAIPGGHVRGMTTAVGHTQTRVLSSGAASMGEGTTGLASVVVMSVPRSGLVTTAPGSGVGTTLSQSSSIARTSAPVVTATTTYHVPRGAAAVANIAAPRPGTTALGRTTTGATAITHASKWVHRTDAGSLVTGIRGLGPRTPNPAATWLGAVSQAAAVAGSSRPRAPAVASVASYAQPRAPPLAVTTRPAATQGSRVQVQAESVRPQMLHSSIQKQNSQVRPRLTAAGPTRLSTSVPAPRLLGTPARATSSPATAVLPAQARLGVPGPASVVSLHPVVVSTGTGLPLKPGSARPSLGPKVISQPIHTPASIQITQVPVSAVQAAAKLPSVTSAIPQVPATRAVPTAAGAPLTMEHGPVLSTYNIPAYVYEPSGSGGGGTYQVTGVVARPYPGPTGPGGGPATAASATYTVQTSAAAVLRPSGVVATSAPVKFNPVVVVDPTRSTLPVHSSYLHEGGLAGASIPETAPPPPPPPAVSKPSASPRPSILRKRDNEGSPMKAQKNLTPVLASLGAGTSAATVTVASSVIGQGPPVSPPSPRRPDSRGGGGGNSSGGSTTISATSSPGLGEASEENAPPLNVKHDGVEEVTERPTTEMSPRKKPRKQQLTGNELHEPKFSEDEMEFISEERVKKDVKEAAPPEEPVEKPPAVAPARRPGLTLLGSYRHSWKSRQNHYVRYGDVRPKDERRPTIAELASQKQIIQKLEGWKVHHLSTQMEELSELEQQVTERLAAVLKLMEKRGGKDLEKDLNRVNELIKGNMQRSKVTSDQMQEAKTQVMKIFEHKNHVADILNRCGSKRSLKKREKS